MHPALLNGHKKCTLIERFDGTVVVLRPGFKHEFGRDLRKAKRILDRVGWEINIDIIKGDPVQRRMQE
jgi:hypothetical protein